MPFIKEVTDIENGWDARLQQLEGHADPVYAVFISPDDEMLVSTSSTLVRLWDVVTGVNR